MIYRRKVALNYVNSLFNKRKIWLIDWWLGFTRRGGGLESPKICSILPRSVPWRTRRTWTPGRSVCSPRSPWTLSWSCGGWEVWGPGGGALLQEPCCQGVRCQSQGLQGNIITAIFPPNSDFYKFWIVLPQNIKCIHLICICIILKNNYFDNFKCLT